MLQVSRMLESGSGTQKDLSESFFWWDIKHFSSSIFCCYFALFLGFKKQLIMEVLMLYTLWELHTKLAIQRYLEKISLENKDLSQQLCISFRPSKIWNKLLIVSWDLLNLVEKKQCINLGCCSLPVTIPVMLQLLLVGFVMQHAKDLIWRSPNLQKCSFLVKDATKIIKKLLNSGQRQHAWFVVVSKV